MPRSSHDRRLSIPKPNYTAAACAIGLILITAAVSFVAFALISSPHATSRILNLVQIPVVNSLAMVAFATLFAGYGTGIIAWLALFLVHRTGMHRLALAETAHPPHLLNC